jgi:23S rRNA pseudouridine1911/1915/1917 synthase
MDHSAILSSKKGEEKSFSISVAARDQGKRIDRFLSESALHLSRSHAKHLIEQKKIFLDGHPVKPSAHLKAGNTISGTLPRPAPLFLKPEPLPLAVLFEDSFMIVVDKPPGMVVHPAPGNPSGTLVNALLHHCRDLPGINGVIRPGIVHRLDKETSGVMAVAKDDSSYHELARQFKNRTVDKVYLAVAHGHVKQAEGLVDAPIGRHPDQRKKMSTKTRKGRTALTRWKVLERLGPFTFLEIYPQTGRTHQIRVHLSSMGNPLLGDPLYGRKGKSATTDDPVLRACVKRMNRQALHAHKLALNHPRTGERVQFVAPIPQDMEETLECLRSRR